MECTIMLLACGFLLVIVEGADNNLLNWIFAEAKNNKIFTQFMLALVNISSIYFLTTVTEF
jgi:hypothetical protein